MTGRMGNISLHLPSSAKLIVVLLFISLFVGQSGCATTTPPSLSEEVREKIGTVGITSACFLPKADIEWPSIGSGVLHRIGEPMQHEYANNMYDPRPLLGLLLAPVNAVLGAIEGSKQKKEAEVTKAAINKAISELKIQNTMKDYVFQMAKEYTCNNLLLCDIQGPDTPGKEVVYHFLAGEGIDTVLEISVIAFGMKGDYPPLYLFMTLHTRLVRTSDGSVLYTQDLEFRSARWTFSEWAADDCKLLREEFNFCFNNLAERVVKGIFLPCYHPLEPAQQSGSNRENKGNHQE